MKVRKNIILLLLLIFSVFVNAQNIDMNEEIVGMIITDSNPIIVTNSGYYKIEKEKNDKWLDYYQKIYKDSTIINPNTEIKGDFSLDVIPYILPSNTNYEQFNFDTPIKFGIILQLGKNNKYTFTDYGKNIIDSMLH